MLALPVAILLAARLAGQETVNDTVIAQIKTEGFQRSAVMDTLSWLSDVHGPRLTGTPALRRAGEWARDQLSRWGLTHAALESYGSIGRGWMLERFSIEMTEPQYMRITGYPRAWSPPIASTLAGTPIVVEVKSKDDFDKYRGKLRGAIVMNGKPEPLDIGFQPEAKRLTDEELKKQESAIDPADPSADSAPKSYWDEEQDWQKMLAKQTEIFKFFAAEGVALLVEPSPIAEDVRIGGFYDRAWRPAFPGFVIAREHYGRIVRMLERKQPVKVAFTLAAQFAENVDGFNVVAEIAGTDPVLRSEIVMLGGHLDSWHAGTGATDNAAGCAVAMEAVRILQTIGVRPRRTIRLALWTGEEQDYFGSLGYVEKHFGDPKNDDAPAGAREAVGLFQSGQRQRPHSRHQSAGQRGRPADLRRVAAPVQLHRRGDGDDAQHRRYRSHAVRRRGPSRLSVHPGSPQLRHQSSPLEPGCL